MTCKKPHHYSPEELAAAWKADLLNDAKCSEEQAANGPYYPEKGITKETLLKYAADCRQKAGVPIPSEFKHSKVSAI
jgi:hypothetical protein